MRGRAEQAYLWRRSRAGRARAGDSQGQGEERNETQTTSEPKRGTANYEPEVREGSPLPPSARTAGPPPDPAAQCTVMVA